MSLAEMRRLLEIILILRLRRILRLDASLRLFGLTRCCKRGDVPQGIVRDVVVCGEFDAARCLRK